MVSEKMIEHDFNRVEEHATKFTNKLGVGFETCEDKGEKSAPMFVPISNYHKEENTLKSTKSHYPSNPKPSFNPKREEASICMFCGRAGHLDEFYFCHKRIEKRRFDYARNSYRDEFIDFLPRTSSRASPHFFHAPNHRSYGFGSRENSFVPRRFGYGPRSHHGDRPPRRHDFPTGGSYTRFESRHLDSPCFPCHGSCPTRSNGEVQKIVKTSSGRMVKCWIPKFYLTNPSTEPSTSSHPMQVIDKGLENKWIMDSSCSRHMTRNKKWFSSLSPLSHKEYVTFGQDKKGKVLGTGIISVNDYFTLNDVALVDKLRYNLLSVSQLVDADLDVLFYKSSSQVLDSSGKLVCGISHLGKVFQANFSFAQSSIKCLISQSSSELWKWHKRLGHLSFDLLCQLSGLGLLQGLPLLKFESNLVCFPCHHGKMIAASHSPINTVMSE
jgi:hypothetical protein